MGAWMNKLRGLNVQHVPYRGGAQGINDVVGGHIDMFYGGVAAGKAAIDGGWVKAIAVTGDTRSSALPDVPTFKEAGVPEFELASWTVMLAPKGTPAEIVALLRKETLAALDDPARPARRSPSKASRKARSRMCGRSSKMSEANSAARCASSASRWDSENRAQQEFGAPGEIRTPDP